MDYSRADFAPLRDTVYGIGLHWTTRTMPRTGDPLPFDQAVAAFDVPAFVQQAVDAGAGHVLFTSCHSHHWLCCPNPVVDEIVPGHTCERDLLMDLADGLAPHGIRLIVYYNHGIHPNSPDAAWQAACGIHDATRDRYHDNYTRLIAWMGERYGPKIAAWWFDGGYHLNEVPDAPWDRFTAAAKAGQPDRLVCYNAGIEKHTMYTELQDYWAGEVCRLNYTPRGPLTPGGLPWYAFVSWYADPSRPLCGVWVMDEKHRELDWPAPRPECVVDLLRRFQACDGAVTFNVFCTQDGSLFDADLAVLRQVKQIVRG
ncbi:alpha-L-fucosidase [bacterium]|nr:alpha-L-fucosidase [bacterium]